MAWIAVRTEAGEELASFELDGYELDGTPWNRDLGKAVPGLVAAIQHALERDRTSR